MSKNVKSTRPEWTTRPSISVDELSFFTRKILGQTLTVIDASVSDPKQNKAIKDLVQKQTWDVYNTVFDWAMQQTEGRSSMFPARPDTERVPYLG